MIQSKTDLSKGRRIRLFVLILSVIGYTGCIVIFFPGIRQLIIRLAEHILHRSLNNEIWMYKQLSAAVVLMTVIWAGNFYYFFSCKNLISYKWFAGTGIFFIIIFLFITTKMSYMNSDNSWYAIMGRGIAEGNILLTNWVGNTISQYFPYAIVEAFWSLFIHSYRDVHALSIISLVVILCCILFLAVKGLSNKNPNILSILPLAVIVTAMHPSILTDCFAHVAPLLCTLTAAYLYYNAGVKKYAKWGVIALLVCWVDNYNIVYFLVPIIAENILYYKKNRKIDPMAKYFMLGIIAYIIRRLAFKHIGGGMYVPGHGNILNLAMTITEFDSIGFRLSHFYLSFSAMFSSNFWGMKLHKMIFVLPLAITMCFSLWLQCRYTVKIYKENSFRENRFMIFFIISSILILGVQLFSSMPIASRYNSGLFINSLVILGYWLNTKYANEVKKLGMIFMIIFVASVAYQLGQGRHKTNELLRERINIVKIIRAENLHSGYAWYGNALSTNFIMNEQKVATIIGLNSPYRWNIDKKVFYPSDKFDFILTWKNSNDGEWVYDRSDEEIRQQFGIPKKTIEQDRVRIYVYDDITDKVQKPELN